MGRDEGAAAAGASSSPMATGSHLSRKRGRISCTEDHFEVDPGGPLEGVLSVAKLRVGQEAYHLSGVAQSLDAYYTGAGEAAGVWVGGSATLLGLEGEVDPDALRAA